jgi:hypothetical protein
MDLASAWADSENDFRVCVAKERKTTTGKASICH